MAVPTSLELGQGHVLNSPVGGTAAHLFTPPGSTGPGRFGDQQKRKAAAAEPASGINQPRRTGKTGPAACAVEGGGREAARGNVLSARSPSRWSQHTVWPTAKGIWRLDGRRR